MMTTPTQGDFNRIGAEAFSKYQKGEKKHGVIDLSTDPRDFLIETRDELLDAIVYIKFEILRIEKILMAAEKMEKIKRLEAEGKL